MPQNSRTHLPSRERLDDRLKIAVAPGDKRRWFELAAARRVTVSELIRQTMASINVTAA